MAAKKAKEEAEQVPEETEEDYEDSLWYFNSLISEGLALSSRQQAEWRRWSGLEPKNAKRRKRKEEMDEETVLSVTRAPRICGHLFCVCVP